MSRTHYFYHGHIRTAIAQFGALFADMSVVRYNADGVPVSIINPIPIKYSNQDPDLGLNSQGVNTDKQGRAGKGFQDFFPRMEFKISGSIDKDEPRYSGAGNRIATESDGIWSRYSTPMSFLIPFDLTIVAKNQFDAFQLWEQISTRFTCPVNIKTKDYPIVGCAYDVPVTYLGMSIDDNYDVGYEDASRIVAITMSFQMSIHMYGPGGGAIEYKIQEMLINNYAEKHGCQELLGADIDDMRNKYADARDIDVKKITEMRYRLQQIEEANPGPIQEICLSFNATSNRLVPSNTPFTADPCFEDDLIVRDNSFFDDSFVEPDEILFVTEKNS